MDDDDDDGTRAPGGVQQLRGFFFLFIFLFLFFFFPCGIEGGRAAAAGQGQAGQGQAGPGRAGQGQRERGRAGAAGAGARERVTPRSRMTRSGIVVAGDCPVACTPRLVLSARHATLSSSSRWRANDARSHRGAIRNRHSTRSFVSAARACSAPGGGRLSRADAWSDGGVVVQAWCGWWCRHVRVRACVKEAAGRHRDGHETPLSRLCLGVLGRA